MFPAVAGMGAVSLRYNPGFAEAGAEARLIPGPAAGSATSTKLTMRDTVLRVNWRNCLRITATPHVPEALAPAAVWIARDAGPGSRASRIFERSRRSNIIFIGMDARISRKMRERIKTQPPQSLYLCFAPGLSNRPCFIASCGRAKGQVGRRSASCRIDSLKAREDKYLR